MMLPTQPYPNSPSHHFLSVTGQDWPEYLAVICGLWSSITRLNSSSLWWVTAKIRFWFTRLTHSQGYTDPVVGSRKSAAIVGDKAKDGYEGATHHGTNSKSGEYNGKDDKGITTYFFFTLTAVTGHHTIYTIRQTVTDTEWEIDV